MGMGGEGCLCKFGRSGDMKVGGEEGGTLHRGSSTGKGTEARAPMTCRRVTTEAGGELAQTPEALSAETVVRFWDCPIGNTLCYPTCGP